jgi:hypothetical protein
MMQFHVLAHLTCLTRAFAAPLVSRRSERQRAVNTPEAINGQFFVQRRAACAA